jgi:hypothetical protein
MHRRPLFFAVALSGLLLILHLWFLGDFYYWQYRWIDNPMHVLGGAALGTFLLAFISPRRATLYLATIFALTVAWEVFEYVAGISTNQPQYWIDTIKDIANGVVGSCIPLYIAQLNLKN